MRKLPPLPTPPKSNKGFVLQNTVNKKICRTFHHNPHTPDGKVFIYYEKDPGKRNWDTQGYLVHRSNLKFIGFID